MYSIVSGKLSLSASSFVRLLVDLSVDDPLPERFRFIGILRRVVSARCGNDGDEKCGLGVIELARTLAEVGLRRLFDSVGGTAKVDRVEVARKDLVLVELLIDFDGHDHFAHLAGIRGDLARVVVLDVLLGDRRSPLAGAARKVVHESAHDTLRRNAAVLVERGVLGGDDSLLDVVRDLVGGQDRAIEVAELAEESLSVRVVHAGRLSNGDIGRLGYLGSRIQPRTEAHASTEENEDGRGKEAPRGKPPRKPFFSGARVVEKVRGLGFGLGLRRSRACCRFSVPAFRGRGVFGARFRAAATNARCRGSGRRARCTLSARAGTARSLWALVAHFEVPLVAGALSCAPLCAHHS